MNWDTMLSHPNDPDNVKVEEHFNTCTEPWCVEHREEALERIAQRRLINGMLHAAHERAKGAGR